MQEANRHNSWIMRGLKCIFASLQMGGLDSEDCCEMHQTQTFVHLTTGLFDLTDSVVPPSFFDSQSEGAPAANI